MIKFILKIKNKYIFIFYGPVIKIIFDWVLATPGRVTLEAGIKKNRLCKQKALLNKSKAYSSRKKKKKNCS